MCARDRTGVPCLCFSWRFVARFFRLRRCAGSGSPRSRPERRSPGGAGARSGLALRPTDRHRGAGPGGDPSASRRRVASFARLSCGLGRAPDSCLAPHGCDPGLAAGGGTPCRGGPPGGGLRGTPDVRGGACPVRSPAAEDSGHDPGATPGGRGDGAPSRVRPEPQGHGCLGAPRSRDAPDSFRRHRGSATAPRALNPPCGGFKARFLPPVPM